jgi:signal transduction histidine kinase
MARMRRRHNFLLNFHNRQACKKCVWRFSSGKISLVLLNGNRTSLTEVVVFTSLSVWFTGLGRILSLRASYEESISLCVWAHVLRVFGVNPVNRILFSVMCVVGVLPVITGLTAEALDVVGGATNESLGQTRDLELNLGRLPDQGTLQSSGFISGVTESSPALMLRSVEINGRSLSGISNAALYLPAHPDITSFIYGPNPLASNAPLRFRCQLDGYEQRWHERSVLMRMMIRFIDSNQREIAEQVFAVMGESPGWTGSFTDSPWIRRKESVTVPADAVRFWVVISSAGPPEAVGFFAVRNLMLGPSQGDTNGTRIIPPVKPDDSSVAVEVTKVLPTGWDRGGLRPANARILRYGPGSEVALAILDDHPKGHADWNTAKVQGPVLTPGERLTFEWEEIYSIGAADYGKADYLKLPAGLYRFRMEALNLMGVPTGYNVSQLVTVPVAAWKTLWFWIAAGLALFAIVAGSWRLTAWRRMKRQVQYLERQRDLEQERFRIAQNIHDDLGARVTEIALLSSSAQLKPNMSSEARAEFGAVTRLTNDLVRALYETVWAVNPKNDHLDSLASFVCQLANQMCAQAQLRCRLEIPDLPAEIPVPSHVRHNVIMAVKEAIHNVIKHGRASEIQIGIQQNGQTLILQVSDNGCGFDPAIVVRGNGLDNMEQRLRSLQGSCSITSRPGVGTKVILEFPLPVS